jgi:hypothetical protein
MQRGVTETVTRCAAIVGFVVVGLLLFAGGSAATSASAVERARTSWRSTEAILPANAAAGADQDVSITSVSCASAGNCSAVGTYQDSSGVEQGLLLTEKRGRWRTGVEAALPGNAGSGAYLSSVSCGAPGDCTAVGRYAHGGLLLTEKAGTWRTGVEAALPANAKSGPFGTFVLLNSVSCASAGNCSAVGTYEDSSGRDEGLLLTEKRGTWRTGVEAALPQSSGGASLTSVSCASSGNCSAVGTSGFDGLLLTERSGRWRTGVEAALPDDAIAGKPVSLTSISCASAGNCGAVGSYDNDVTSKDLTINGGLLLTERNGRWRTGVRAKDPGEPSATAVQTDVNSVSCARAGECVAVGDYSAAQAVYGLLLSQKAGRWRAGIKPRLPAGAEAKGFVSLTSVSCATPGSCAAVGSYQDRSGADRGLLLTETAGAWTTGRKAPAHAGPPAGLSAVSCSSSLDCTAVGSEEGAGGQGLLLDGFAKPCAVPKLKGMTLLAARRSLGSHGCSVGTIEHARSRTVERGRVISQRPKPGRRLDDGAKVSLEVSRGP